MTDDTPAIDVVRSSRDGHQFHEAWAARIALELLPPDTSLRALSIEGFSFEELSHAAVMNPPTTAPAPMTDAMMP